MTMPLQMQALAEAPPSASLLRMRHPRHARPLPAVDDEPTDDQARGLRQLFSGPSLCHLALVANPHVRDGGGVLERLGSALCALGLRTLVVDAADTSPPAAELAGFDLRGCIERLSPQLSYLAARGLPLRHVDNRGSAAAWLDELHVAAPATQVLLVHADAADLARLYSRQAVRPLLLAGDSAESLTHAYAALKLLTLRRRMLSFDVLVAQAAAATARQRAAAVATRLASCAERFLGASVHDWVAIDPACDVREPCDDALLRLLATHLAGDVDERAAHAPTILN
jgi:flagellar biosynthesis protein FlhG